MKLLCILGIFVTFSAFADAQHQPSRYQPQVLEKIVERAHEMRLQGRRPVVVFDVDDTLFDSRTRTAVIFKQFTQEPTMRSQFSLETRVLASIRLDEIQYELKDTLHNLYIDTPAFESALSAYWVSHFFTNTYCALDRTIPGAAKYVYDLEKAGAYIIYLTGRNSPHMGEGTSASFVKNHFPTDPQGTYLLMKQDPAMSDITFKQQSFAWINQQGTVIAGFENEPKNINAYDAAFPGGIMVFLDTIHSDAPDVPNPDVYWVGDFEANFSNVPSM